MAHRHTVQKRAHGGRSGFSAGGKANPFSRNFSSPGGNKVADEAKSEKETFKRGGKSVAKAHGGGVKSRGDRRSRGGALFEKGGSVWSHAASGLRGKKGFAATPHDDGSREHGEKHDAKAHGAGTEGHTAREAHGGKAKHQYAKGGAVKDKASGGPVAVRAKRKHGGKTSHEEDDEEAEDEGDSTAARGGRMHKTSVSYQSRRGPMHPAHVHKGKGGGRKAGGGEVEPDADDMGRG